MSRATVQQQKPQAEPGEKKRRKRKYELYTGSGSEEEEKKKAPPPPRGPRPPPIVDYHALLQLANAKQHEPVVIERLAAPRPEESRPLTKQEKERRMEEELHRKVCVEGEETALPRQQRGWGL